MNLPLSRAGLVNGNRKSPFSGLSKIRSPGFATTPFDGELLRRLAVLKLWQARDPFDPEAFFEKLSSGDYDWADIERLVRASDRIKPDEIISSVEKRFAVLHQLTVLEQQVIADAKSGCNEPLAERLRAETGELANARTGMPG